MSTVPIRSFQAGAGLPSASHLNEIVGAVNALRSLRGDGIIEIQATADGLTMRLSVENLLARIGRKPAVLLILTGTPTWSTVAEAMDVGELILWQPPQQT